MNFRFALLLFLVQSTIAFSQEKFLPEIKKGVTLNYQVSVNGQLFPVQMKVDSLGPEYTRFNWSMQDGSGGYVINTKNSLESAVKGYWGELQNGSDLTMPNDQIILMLSKSVWNSIQKDKKFTLDEQQYTVKEQPGNAIFQLKGSPINVIYAETANGATKVWFLNNPSAPLLVKIEGNPMGIDINLASID
jgi:hypothetical protein